MAQISVWDKEGKEHQRETVDARECVAQLGWTLTAPESDAKASLAVSEIKERLTAAGIEIPQGAKKAELLALLPD